MTEKFVNKVASIMAELTIGAIIVSGIVLLTTDKPYRYLGFVSVLLLVNTIHNLVVKDREVRMLSKVLGDTLSDLVKSKIELDVSRSREAKNTRAKRKKKAEKVKK